MSTEILDKVNAEVSKIIDDVTNPEAENKFSTIVKVICITTDKKSFKNSNKLLKELDKVLEHKLPKEASNINIENLKLSLININKNLASIDKFLAFVKQLTNSSPEIEMDEGHVLEFLGNMQKVSKKFNYISDYLAMVIQVYYDKQLPKSTSSFTELINKIKAA